MEFEDANTKTDEFVEAVKGKRKEYDTPDTVSDLFS
jgi:hypothetical protein